MSAPGLAGSHDLQGRDPFLTLAFWALRAGGAASMQTVVALSAE